MELLAYAVSDLFPSVKLGMGKASNVDFFYDFIFDKPLTDQGLSLIEERWRRAIKEFANFEIREMMRENAASLFQHYDQPLKAEEALAKNSNIVSLLHLDHFYDLMPEAGWELVEERIYPKLFFQFTYEYAGLQITRLEGAAFADQTELKSYQRKRKHSRSHLELGQELDLFNCDKGEWFFNARGEALKKIIGSAVVRAGGFHEISFSDNMPPNLSENIAFWSKKSPKGDINSGLLQPFSCNCLEIYMLGGGQSLYENCISSLQFIQKIIKIFDLNHEWVLRNYRPQEVSKKKWQTQVDLLKSTAEQCNICYCSDSGPDNSFSENSYPQIELSVYDALGRRWPISAVKFANYGNKEVVVVLPLLSLETFVALLLEQTSGSIPNWLQPEQVRVLPIAKEFMEMAKIVQQDLIDNNIRAGLDAGIEKLADKIRLGVQHQIPYLLVIGEEEKKNGLIAVRRFGEEKVSAMRLEDFIHGAKQELKTKL